MAKDTDVKMEDAGEKEGLLVQEDLDEKWVPVP